MKGKVIIVLFSLALVFGMIVASCDNGTDPRLSYVPTANKYVGELGDELKKPASTPPTTWAGLDTSKIYLDYYDNSLYPDLVVPGDGTIDKTAGGDEIWITLDAAQALVGKKYYAYTYTAATGTVDGTTVAVLKLQ